jgi:lipopolysaccharide/colanic/teichoic acid biosynthesis glycosyltransferase
VGADSLYVKTVKPFLDWLVAIMALVVVFPVFLTVYFVLKLSSGGAAFFSQERIGYREKKFIAYKFKTMNDRKDNYGNLLPDAERLTQVGNWIRRTSLDELPQLWNIIKGDMSFVGPRPLLPEYLPYYDERQKKRHSVKPGITGLAQVNGRNLTTWEKRFDLDIQYIEKISFALDMKILLMTIIKVIKSEGISAEGHATMPKFSEYVKQKRQ